MDAMKTSRDCLDEALSKEIEEKRDLSTRVGFLEQKLSLKTEECERFESSVNNLEQKFEAAEIAKKSKIESKFLEIEVTLSSAVSGDTPLLEAINVIAYEL